MKYRDHRGSLEDALKTIKFLEDNRHKIGEITSNTFGLYAGSHIDNNPSTYGVSKVYKEDRPDLPETGPRLPAAHGGLSFRRIDHAQ